jgi:hypothetical protein
VYRLGITVALLLMGCSFTSNTNNFAGGGSDFRPSTSDTGDTAMPVSSTPYLGAVSAVFDEYPSYGDVIEVTAAYTDSEDDLEGGAVYLTVGLIKSDGATSDAELEISIDGTNAWTSDGDLVYVIGGESLDTSGSYSISFSITDLAGNESNEVDATCK